MLFLLFAIPLPMFLLNGIIRMLQAASAVATGVVFTVIGVPYHRSGMVFELTRVAVEVAEQCSGTRSSLALVILSVIAGSMTLKSVRIRTLLVIAVFPITVFKNALRITTVSLLANYVDLTFLTNHSIHR